MMRRGLATAGTLLGLGALGVQAALTLPARLEAGDPVWLALVFYFSFFTILTNLLATLVLAAQALPGAPLAIFRKRSVQGLAVPAMAFVGIFYYLLLRDLWAPEGPWLVADTLLHAVMPIAYLAFWLVWLADGRLRVSVLWRWLAYPLLYLALVFARGLVTGAYPYALLDLGPHGWGPVIPRVVGLLFAFLVLSALTLVVDRLVSRLLRRGRRAS